MLERLYFTEETRTQMFKAWKEKIFQQYQPMGSSQRHEDLDLLERVEGKVYFLVACISKTGLRGGYASLLSLGKGSADWQELYIAGILYLPLPWA